MGVSRRSNSHERIAARGPTLRRHSNSPSKHHQPAMENTQLPGDNARIQTALSCAMIRAAHLLHGEQPLVFADPLAMKLLDHHGREHCLQDKAIAQGGGAGVVLGRARYTEELLERAAGSGVTQYVLLGAGMDTFAMRRADLLGRMRVFEIDRPEVQSWKQQRLNQCGEKLPAALEFIPIDFDNQSIRAVLEGSTYCSKQRAFFSWLGVLPYLTEETILSTLEAIAAATVAGSEIIFDYRVAMQFVDPDDVPLVQAGDRFTAQAGEPKRSFLNPHTFPAEVCKRGYRLIENLSARQLGERYFANRGDGLYPRSHHYYGHFRRT